MRIRKSLNFARPNDVPKGWHIHNAPRPLYGDITWQGDFLSGIFYAALDPQGEQYDWQRQQNESLDATRVIPVTENFVVEEMSEYYHQNYPDLAFDPADPDTRRQLVQTWFNLDRHILEEK